MIFSNKNIIGKYFWKVKAVGRIFIVAAEKENKAPR
jgi:hypothetical protein